MLVLKHRGQERSRQFGEVEQEFAAWRKRWTSVQPSLRQLRRPAGAADARSAPSAARVLEFVEWSMGHIKALESRVDSLSRSAAQEQHIVARRVDDLLLQSKSLLMAPFSTLVDWMPKMVRDLARSQGKQAELVIEGDDAQVDRRLIDEMKDPLIHLLRNAVDHGVESPAERAAAGKPEKATLQLEIRFASGDRIELVVRDDGRGIDTLAVREAAVRIGLVDAAAAELDDVEASDLVFRSQLSTRPAVTDLSGRGLGLAIVKEQAEKLGGQVFARSEPGRGCTFRIVLPQRLGALRGLFVRVGDATLVIPGMNVVSVARIAHSEAKLVQGRETVLRAGRVIPLMALGEVLRPRNYRGLEDTALLTVVFIEAGSEVLALAVDDVLDEEEILIKRLEPPLQRVRNIAGATVRPSGKVFPVLNVADLVRSVRRAKTGEAARTTVARTQPAAKARILLAEDSITSRLLLKGILEAAGYDVRTAADGVEAFTALRTGAFDLLVSDIEMPRLNGFDLTVRIRADSALRDLPVVLVTALARKEDREHGIEAGANAYIAKGSFDQRELVDAVRRLLALGERG
jgi:two-component system chemotaxis sensor kinase CheA